MSHESDNALANFFAEEEQKSRLWHSHGMPGLGTLRGELFGEDEVPDCNLRYELTFWNLHLHDNPGTWGTYYCPESCQMEGKRHEFPQRSEITKACVEYWEQRAGTSQHPLL